MPTLVIGLLYLTIDIGNVLGLTVGGPWSDYVMHREAKKDGSCDEDGKLVLRPEDRARANVWVGFLGYAFAFLWYRWEVEKDVHWAVSAC